MTFMIKKKRYKFVVDLVIDELTEVSYSKGIMFAKIRQLDGGSFSDVSKRVEVQNHAVKYNDRFIFPCKMFASSASVILETCKCRISIRMEEKGGKHFRKIGFADVNMAEYAGAGTSTQKYILQAYDTRHRLDNSMLQITLNITLKEGDTIFQRPLNRSTPYVLPGEEESQESGSTPPSSKSLTVVPTSSSDLVKQLTHSPSLSTVPSSSMTSGNIMSTSVGCIGIEFSLEDNNHTRNSSATSQTSAGYISSSNGGMVPPHHPPVSSGGPPTAHLQGHSRQSSSGDSCHGSQKKSSVPRVQSFIELIAKRGQLLSLSHKTHSFPGDFSSASIIQENSEAVNRCSSFKHPRYFHRRTMSNIESLRSISCRDSYSRFYYHHFFACFILV